MDPVTLVAAGWTTRALEASSFLDRWRGFKRSSEGMAVLLPVSSVHGVGLDEPLLVVPIDAGMTVGEIRTLRRGRFLTFPGAKYVLELPAGAQPPPPGSVIEVRRG